MRFRQAGAVVAALVVSAIAVVYTANGEGPFAGGAHDLDLLRAQVFVALAAMTGLLVAAMRTEWERAEAALARLGESERALAEAQQLAAHRQLGLGRARRTASSWSDELLRIFGVERDGFDATRESYMGHPSRRSRTRRTRDRGRAARARGRSSFEHRVLRPDGERADDRLPRPRRSSARTAAPCSCSAPRRT